MIELENQRVLNKIVGLKREETTYKRREVASFNELIGKEKKGFLKRKKKTV
jgi:hypothetical protein